MMLRAFTIVAAFALCACSAIEPKSGEQMGSDEVTHELAGTRWALVSLGDRRVTISEGGREAYIALNAVESSMVGFAGCNRISSKYQSNDAQLSFEAVIATRMYCQDMPTETALVEALESTAAWRITGSQLQLLDANQKTLARFEARNL